MIGTILENILEKYMFKVTKSVSIYLGDNTDICNRANLCFHLIVDNNLIFLI